MPQRLLIIDDSLFIQQIVQKSLADQALQLEFASTGEEGLRLAVDHQPDVVLLDVEMPDPNGFEICRRMKANEATKHIPIVFLTSHTGTEEKVKGLDLGALDYVTKPFKPAELCARVRSALRVKFMQDILAEKAMIDGLTGLWNRRYLEQRIDQEMSLAIRENGRFSLVMVDIDHFKSINDSHGHPFGDDMLRVVARELLDGIRKEDTVCRFGGEEFAMLLPRVGTAGAAVLADRVRSAIHSLEIEHRGSQVKLSASFGVAESTALSATTLVEAADQALYRAKKLGRNRVEIDKAGRSSDPGSRATMTGDTNATRCVEGIANAY